MIVLGAASSLLTILSCGVTALTRRRFQPLLLGGLHIVLSACFFVAWLPLGESQLQQTYAVTHHPVTVYVFERSAMNDGFKGSEILVRPAFSPLLRYARSTSGQVQRITEKDAWVSDFPKSIRIK